MSFRTAVFLLQLQLKEVSVPESPEATEFREAYENYLRIQGELAEGPYAEILRIVEDSRVHRDRDRCVAIA